MKEITLSLETLGCPACGMKIEKGLEKTEGVSSAEVLFNASKAKVTFDEAKTDIEKVVGTVTSLGYEVLDVEV
ncbi:MAG TPA: heavy-metal-associated domain-containing protein [Erysipelothrix sp.]|nr:heavy-metal-associated domain-containing protein [Erysipelothrix sp.]